MSENNYILTSDGELYHHGILGMKWGVRRYQNKDGSMTSAGKKRYATSLTDRKISRDDDPNERKKRIDADIKEADDRVKFYGSKRAAKTAIRDEADYAKSVNRGKAFVDTLKYGGTSGIAGAALMGIAGTSGLGVVVGFATPVAVAGTVAAVVAKKANNIIKKHAQDQIHYTDESEYGHDIVVTMKKTD